MGRPTTQTIPQDEWNEISKPVRDALATYRKARGVFRGVLFPIPVVSNLQAWLSHDGDKPSWEAWWQLQKIRQSFRDEDLPVTEDAALRSAISTDDVVPDVVLVSQEHLENALAETATHENREAAFHALSQKPIDHVDKSAMALASEVLEEKVFLQKTTDLTQQENKTLEAIKRDLLARYKDQRPFWQRFWFAPPSIKFLRQLKCWDVDTLLKFCELPKPASTSYLSALHTDLMASLFAKPENIALDNVAKDLTLLKKAAYIEGQDVNDVLQVSGLFHRHPRFDESLTNVIRLLNEEVLLSKDLVSLVSGDYPQVSDEALEFVILLMKNNDEGRAWQPHFQWVLDHMKAQNITDKKFYDQENLTNLARVCDAMVSMVKAVPEADVARARQRIFSGFSVVATDSNDSASSIFRLLLTPKRLERLAPMIQAMQEQGMAQQWWGMLSDENYLGTVTAHPTLALTDKQFWDEFKEAQQNNKNTTKTLSDAMETIFRETSAQKTDRLRYRVIEDVIDTINALKDNKSLPPVADNQVDYKGACALLADCFGDGTKIDEAFFQKQQEAIETITKKIYVDTFGEVAEDNWGSIYDQMVEKIKNSFLIQDEQEDEDLDHDPLASGSGEMYSSVTAVTEEADAGQRPVEKEVPLDVRDDALPNNVTCQQ
ncbi:MAG: hypothetical protein DHS20C10_12110 [marine bacterium B5-7]|nr:MAG: hypothetical protein DHS20C10_12110 [marine bacterium B5-7]